MGWRAKAGREQKQLASIATRLLDLADMAERSVRDLPWVRWCVLWAAWQADLVTRDYVVRTTWNEAGRLWSPALIPVRYGTGAMDAFDIAASLRSLALIVGGMAAQSGHLSFLHRGQASDEADNEGGVHHGVLRRRANAVVSPVELRDTS